MKTKIISTCKGPVIAQISGDEGVNRLNALHCPGGVGFFLVFPGGPEQQMAMVQAARSLAEGEDLEPNQDISSRVAGCLAAGTGGRVMFDVGVPEVSHAQ